MGVRMHQRHPFAGDVGPPSLAKAAVHLLGGDSRSQVTLYLHQRQGDTRSAFVGQGTQKIGHHAFGGDVTCEIPERLVHRCAHVGMQEQAVRDAMKQVSFGGKAGALEPGEHMPGIEGEEITVSGKRRGELHGDGMQAPNRRREEVVVGKHCRLGQVHNLQCQLFSACHGLLVLRFPWARCAACTISR